MIVDLNNQANIDNQASDVIIIGAGAVGLTLAVTLGRQGVRVLLLESGGGQFEKQSQDLNCYSLSGRDHDGILNGRARTVGGSTTLWGGQLVPFSPIDFERRAWLPVSGWPITYDDVQPFYRQTASLLGLNLKFEDDQEVWRSLNSEQIDLGDNIVPFLTRWMKETSIFKMFKHEIVNSEQITLVKHAITHGFESSDNNQQIEQVLVKNQAGQAHSFTGQQVILACGTIEASRLMLYAAEKNNRLPWHDNPLVGAYFQDHLDIHIAKVTPIDKKKFSQAFDKIYVGGAKFEPKLRLSEEFQHKAQTLNIASSFIFDSSLTEQYTNIKLFLRALLRGSVPQDWKQFPQHLKTIFSIFVPMAIRYIKDRRILSLSDKGIYLNLHCEQVPLRDSRITLDWSKADAVGMPAADLNWQVDSQEIHSMSTFCNELNQHLQQQGLAKLDTVKELETADPRLLDKCRDTNHQCGGLRMADSKEEGVVDKNLRVFGTSNMYVAGAATFPTSSFANPTFHAIALGLRLADQLVKQRG